MGAFRDERRAIEQRFAANFTALPVKYGSAPFAQPANAPWVRLTILNGEGRQASIGDKPLHRYAGVIQVDIFVPESAVGAHDLARRHGDDIIAAFRTPTGAPVQFQAGASGVITARTASYVERDIKDGWLRAVVTVPFARDKIF